MFIIGSDGLMNWKWFNLRDLCSSVNNLVWICIIPRVMLIIAFWGLEYKGLLLHVEVFDIENEMSFVVEVNDVFAFEFVLWCILLMLFNESKRFLFSFVFLGVIWVGGVGDIFLELLL